ncbi:MAG: SpoIIE family protein phosphatase, partial [Muribaculaceae bacterium]|nr:SpoIIE family protein phosphatase [Muribaculaceae bacterium]
MSSLMESTYSTSSLTGLAGAKLFLYTDGVPETTDNNGSMFGLERMLDALNTDTA